MQFHLQNNIEKQRKEDAKAIPQVALSAQNKTQSGRYFLEGSKLTNAAVIDNPSNWSQDLEASVAANTNDYESVYIAINYEDGEDAVALLLSSSIEGLEISNVVTTTGQVQITLNQPVLSYRTLAISGGYFGQGTATQSLAERISTTIFRVQYRNTATGALSEPGMDGIEQVVELKIFPAN